jgi:acyl-CoA synthetase (AMP-forming)/AMP-acid ligase II
MQDRLRRPANDGIGSWIVRRAAAAPDDVAVVFGRVRLTYAETAARIDRLACLLQDRGIRHGDRVAYQGPNHPVALESLFAAATLGAVWVPILPGRDPSDVRFILEDCGVRLLIRGEVDDPTPPGPRVTTGEIEPALAEEASGRAPVDAEVSLEDLAVLGYTSGTTGRPKGTMLTHANLTWNVVNVLSACPIGGSDRALALAPMTRLGGIGVTVLETLFTGGTVVIPHDRRPAALLETIQRERVTVLFANPEELARFVADPAWPAADLSSLRVAIVGGNVVPEPLLQAYLDRGVPLRHGYGLTEAAPVVTLLDERDARRKFGSVGQPIGLVDVTIEGPDGRELPAGATGEVLVRGPDVTAGYWNRPEATEAASRGNGWWRTGDAGWLDDQGYLYVGGRMREGFLVRGERVFPAQIERLLDGHPDVADAAATGAADGITLFVVPRAGGPADAARLAGRVREALPPHLAPQHVHVVDRIPRNAAGKILRDELRRHTRS